MGNANTEHSRRLRAESAKKALKKAIEEGRIKYKTLCAHPTVIDAFSAHLKRTGQSTVAKQLTAVNQILDGHWQQSPPHKPPQE